MISQTFYLIKLVSDSLGEPVGLNSLGLNIEPDFVQPDRTRTLGSDIKLCPKPNPTASLNETVKEHQRRLVDWEASLSHNSGIKPKGNSTTQAYYTDRLVSVQFVSGQSPTRVATAKLV